MIPIRQGQDQLLVEKVTIWILRIVDDEWASKSIRILAIHVTVVPVGPWLNDLFKSATHKGKHKVKPTVKLYVKVDPGGTGHCVVLATPSM